MKCIQIWQICIKMHPTLLMVSCRCKWVWVWLGGQWLLCRWLLLCSGTLCGQGYGCWFSPSTGRRSGRYVQPVGVAPVPTRSGPQVTNPGYPQLSQFISSWWYPWSTTDIKNYPVFRWTMEVQRGVTRPAAAARKPGEEMNETYGMSTSKGISQNNSVLNFYPLLSRVIHVWLLYPNLSRDMQV